MITTTWVPWEPCPELVSWYIYGLVRIMIMSIIKHAGQRPQQAKVTPEKAYSQCHRRLLHTAFSELSQETLICLILDHNSSRDQENGSRVTSLDNELSMRFTGEASRPASSLALPALGRGRCRD